MLNIALPKGRLGIQVFALFEKAGYEVAKLVKNSRKLVVTDTKNQIRFFLVKSSDVAVYVLHGTADAGVAGRDIILETAPDVYELLDLRLGVCRVAVAGPKNFTEPKGTLRVATKYPNIAKRHYDAKGRGIELITLNGSVELAPILGLSNVIVDIVETGTTLRENDLVIIEEILPVSARLIANMSSYKFKRGEIERLKTAITGEAGK